MTWLMHLGMNKEIQAQTLALIILNRTPKKKPSKESMRQGAEEYNPNQKTPQTEKLRC